MVTKGQPQGGINLPSSSELGGLTLSQACLASSSGRKRLKCEKLGKVGESGQEARRRAGLGLGRASCAARD